MVRYKKVYEVDENASYQSKWLAECLNNCHITCATLAKMLMVSKQTISNWLEGSHPISYCAIYTICGILHLEDNPDMVYGAITMNNALKRWDEMMKGD